MPLPYLTSHYATFSAIPHVPQPAVGVSPSSWVETHALPGVPNVAALPNNAMLRVDVRAVCGDPNQNVLFGYACAMAWGGQGSGRGGSKSVASAWAQNVDIAKKLRQLREGNLTRSQAYELFCGNGKIKGLGPSYFTKLLYFFSPAEEFYIMDQWTAKSINLLTGEHVVRVYDSSPTRDNKGGNYQAYCEEVDGLASVLGQTGDEIEQRLMSEGGRNPAPWRAHVKAHYPYPKNRICALYPHISKSEL